MPLLPLEHLLSHVDSKYRLVIIAAKRAKQLMRGAESLIVPRSFKPTYTALEEVAAGKLMYEAQPAEGAAAQHVIAPETTPTWFRSLSAGEMLAEGVVAEEEEPEEAEVEEAPLEVLADVSKEEAAGEPEMTGLDVLEPPEAEDEA